ncbi:MAG TPA: hypothetical protein VF003_03080 [Pseudonocardiaceae bacterium]
MGGRRGWPGPEHGRAPALAAQESAQRRAVGAGDLAGRLYAQRPLFAVGLPQGRDGLALQNYVCLQADSDRMGSSAGLLRTLSTLARSSPPPPSAPSTVPPPAPAGLHHLAMFMLVIGVLFLAITVADRSLHHISSRQDTPTGTAPR